MEKLQQLIDTLRVSVGRLTQREQFILAGGLAAGVFLILVLIGALVSSAIGREERNVQQKTGQLQQVLSLQSEYKLRQAERAERLRMLGRSNVRLVSLIEDSARQAGVDIGQLRPEDGEASADGVVESRVDLRASGLSADRLQDFLNRLEKSAGIVIVRRLKISRPYRKDVAELEISVSTYKLKA